MKTLLLSIVSILFLITDNAGVIAQSTDLGKLTKKERNTLSV